MKNFLLPIFAILPIVALAEILLVEKSNGDVIELPAENIQEMQFKASNAEYPDNTPECVEIVDLGLSVNWASVNLGATIPEEPGYLVSWGELEEKDWYSWSYYTHGTKNSLTKYCKTDKLNTLESIDDIATVTFGESWRMPTKSEWQELIDNCTIDYTSQENGVNGLRFTSNVAGYENATIFIPVGGKKQDDGITNEGAYGHYWTSECVSSFGMYYNAFVAELSVLGSVSTANIERCYGCNVRAVIAKEVVVE